MNILRFSKLLLTEEEIENFQKNGENIQKLSIHELHHIALDASLVASLWMIKLMNLSIKNIISKNSSPKDS